MTTGIDTKELYAAMMAAEVTVVDALPPAPYRRRHLPGAVNLTAEDPDAVVVQALPRRSRAIVVYSTDEDCDRAPGMVQRLRGLGYSDVRLYGAGIEGWVGSGLGVESDVPEQPSRMPGSR